MDADVDINRWLAVDGNATAGILYDIFAAEMTACPAECAHCGRQGALGSLVTFNQAPGIVMRCPACMNVVLRIVRAPSGIYLDMRGLAFVHMQRW